MGYSKKIATNMDESGFRVGCIAGRIVITFIVKVVYLSDPDNRDLVLVIKCISGAAYSARIGIMMSYCQVDLEQCQLDMS